MEIPSLKTIIFALLSILIVRFIFKYIVKPYIHLQQFKNVKGAICEFIPIVGLVPRLAKNFKMHGDVHYWTRKLVAQNPNLRLMAFPLTDTIHVNLFDAELVKEFLANQTKFTVKNLAIFGVMPEIGLNGLVFAEGEKWKVQRKLISQVFHFEYMNRCIPTINRTAREWISSNCKEDNPKIDVSFQMKMFTASVIWRIFFGEESFAADQDAQKLIEINIKNAGDIVILAMSPLNMIFGAGFFKLGLRSFDREFNRETEMLHNFHQSKFEAFKAKLLDDKQKGIEREGPKNLIELLLEETFKVGGAEKISDKEIIAQIGTFFTAGTDTTAHLLSMSHLFMAEHPQIQEKLRSEVVKYVGDVEEITYEHVSKLEYLGAFLKEVLRFYGPASALFPRIAKEDMKLGDVVIRKGYSVNVSNIGVASNPKYFENPEEFKPERWLDKDGKGINDQRFVPFSGGPRKCIGEHLAVVEAKIMLCSLLRRFKIDIERPYKPKMGFGLAYEAKNHIIATYTSL